MTRSPRAALLAAAIMTVSTAVSAAQSISNVRACSHDNLLTVTWDLDAKLEGFGPLIAVRPRYSTEGTLDPEPRQVRVPDPMHSARVAFDRGSKGMYGVALLKLDGTRIPVGDYHLEDGITDGDCPLELPVGEIVLSALPPLEAALDPPDNAEDNAPPKVATPPQVDPLMTETPARLGESIPAASPAPDRTVESPAPGGIARVGPRVLHRVEPEYSARARAAQLNGTVLLAVEVWEDGLAHNIKVTRGIGCGLDQKAIEAIRKWRFSPGTEDGKPVRTKAQIQVSFRLLSCDDCEPVPCPSKIDQVERGMRRATRIGRDIGVL